jgi:hypothetical protein
VNPASESGDGLLDAREQRRLHVHGLRIVVRHAPTLALSARFRERRA